MSTQKTMLASMHTENPLSRGAAIAQLHRARDFGSKTLIRAWLPGLSAEDHALQGFQNLDSTTFCFMAVSHIMVQCVEKKKKIMASSGNQPRSQLDTASKTLGDITNRSNVPITWRSIDHRSSSDADTMSVPRPRRLTVVRCLSCLCFACCSIQVQGQYTTLANDS
jgi:hypothetical protein